MLFEKLINREVEKRMHEENLRQKRCNYCPNCGAKMDGGNIITGDATIPTISNTEYIDTGIKSSICNEWKTLQDDEEMLRAVGAKGESVTIDRKNKTLTCTDECGHTVTMNPLKIIKNGEIVWSRMDGGNEK